MTLGISNVDVNCDHVNEELPRRLVCQEVRFQQVEGQDFIQVQSFRQLNHKFVRDARSEWVLVSPDKRISGVKDLFS